MMISEHISLAEATKSQEAIRKGLDNTPGMDEIEAMQLVAEKVFEPLRAAMGCPIPLTSFYRSDELNKAIGGSAMSDHCKGRAIDMDRDGLAGPTNADLFHHVREHLPFDQLIWEFGDRTNPAWVHVSYREEGNRGQVLSLQGGRCHEIPAVASLIGRGYKIPSQSLGRIQVWRAEQLPS